jgi:hypothetical protein
MGSIELQIIDEIKTLINEGNLEEIHRLWNEYFLETEFEREVAWDFIFQKVYLHSALKKQKHICDWLDTVFTQFNPIQQIALRQMFSYARYLLNKK